MSLGTGGKSQKEERKKKKKSLLKKREAAHLTDRWPKDAPTWLSNKRGREKRTFKRETERDL